MSDDQRPFGTDRRRHADDSVDWDALARYFARASPDGEAVAVERWLAAHPADAAALAGLDAAVTRAVASRPALNVDVEAALRRVQERRDAAAVEPAHDRHETPVIPLRRPVRAAGLRRRAWLAGGVASVAAAALLAVEAAWSRGPNPSPSARTYATAVGTRDSLRLPDGTRVVVAPGSRLVVAAGYGEAHREVALEGAAWFSVRHDAARPFIVRAGAAVVRDVGTAFTVRTDGVDGPGGVAVAVTEGVVALRAARSATPADTGVLLAAGDRGVLHADGRAVAVRGGVTPDDLAWIRGRLVYRDAPLDRVRADLRRWYGLELRVDDPALARRRLTATFDGTPVERVLEVIALALGAEVERAGDTAVLRSARAGRADGGTR